jgi:hypothetical protein
MDYEIDYSSVPEVEMLFVKSIVADKIFMIKSCPQFTCPEYDGIRSREIIKFNEYFSKFVKNEKILIFHVYKIREHICTEYIYNKSPSINGDDGEGCNFNCKMYRFCHFTRNDKKYSDPIFVENIKTEFINFNRYEYKFEYAFFIMTNYGKILINTEMHEINTWIPIDYIINIKLNPPNYYKLQDTVNRCKEIKFENIHNNFLKINEKIENLYKIINEKDNAAVKLKNEIKNIRIKNKKIIKEKDTIINELEEKNKSILKFKIDEIKPNINKPKEKRIPINEFDISDDEINV